MCKALSSVSSSRTRGIGPVATCNRGFGFRCRCLICRLLREYTSRLKHMMSPLLPDRSDTSGYLDHRNPWYKDSGRHTMPDNLARPAAWAHRRYPHPGRPPRARRASNPSCCRRCMQRRQQPREQFSRALDVTREQPFLDTYRAPIKMGLLRWVVVPSPSCPLELSPQQYRLPVARVAHVWPLPSATAAHGPAGSRILLG